MEGRGGEELRAQADGLAGSRAGLEAELRRYRELFEQAPDAYLVTDADGVVREANAAAAALLGVSEDALRGKPLVVFVPRGRAGPGGGLGVAGARPRPRAPPRPRDAAAVEPVGRPDAEAPLPGLSDETVRSLAEALVLLNLERAAS